MCAPACYCIESENKDYNTACSEKEASSSLHNQTFSSISPLLDIAFVHLARQSYITLAYLSSA
jgi:hypothetical protein